MTSYRFLHLSARRSHMSIASRMGKFVFLKDDVLCQTEIYLKERNLKVDIWKKKNAPDNLPVVFYIHGGAFKSLSKDTHWIMGSQFARAGYLTFVIDYRLAPKHPCPAALFDVMEAYHWICRNAARYGGDCDRLALAGESAGANLALALTLALLHPFEGFESLTEASIKPRVLLPAGGILAVSNTERFYQELGRSMWEDVILQGMERDYQPLNHSLGNPLLFLEEGELLNDFPSTWILSSQDDVVLSDSLRLHENLKERGVDVHLDCEYNEVHAFHAFLWKKTARNSWKKKLSFLNSKMQ